MKNFIFCAVIHQSPNQMGAVIYCHVLSRSFTDASYNSITCLKPEISWVIDSKVFVGIKTFLKGRKNVC